jgi:ElaB/YqjD/DUF883 family membrane-anchored ribosome-binding protein
MKKQIQAINQDLSQLAKDAGVLIAATVDMAGAEIAEARDRLTAALELGKDNVGYVRDSAMQKARAADAAVHEHPYKVIGVGIGVGAFIGFLATSRWACNRDRHSQEKSNL